VGRGLGALPRSPHTQRDGQSILNESFAVHFHGGQQNSEVYCWKAVNLHGFRISAQDVTRTAALPWF
jgi:hypothetical protein